MITTIISLALTSMSTPAIAQDGKPAKDARDPNRMICRTEDVIGSRLGSRRVCLTASQWEDLRRDTRQTTERVQTFQSKN
ncbi:hypothetical protein P1X14_07525 [Sphingomonas sp. AOB5]|uniref:hypothetical protein n=1 Tax=Sphingomonas sp. AOB5 TaxID=3034017 RepID=UPI0023F64191|nr:hypothetical protein [Sphingomonas sp. AOB5]MDF7775091.1 hypothetical protein [Sphingomonas sp. AOB5]